MEIGYARVSTQGQTLEAQLEHLTAAGCGHIYRDVASGARFDRKSLQALLRALKPGSTLVVTRLDRLARSTVDLLTILKAVADRGCSFRSLAEPWADTSTPAGRLMLTVLGGLAEFERGLISARTMEGRERAKRAGVRMGRKPLLSPHQIAEVRERKANGESVRFLARSYGVSPNTISRVRPRIAI
ncbi:recombinase family protein [Bradyrhizobium sp. MOS002]|uniref:recombinase family protein n=1 Tax=Bradyrhizobium sp. MOS002 TaxID=2133947 RepID=UPI000D1180FF|nr:recombinase family protein [Bradyrhizobium sp. MOS002]PSO19783.1 resolvase [Bradyrhizobium sp. MOS002]